MAIVIALLMLVGILLIFGVLLDAQNSPKKKKKKRSPALFSPPPTPVRRHAWTDEDSDETDSEPYESPLGLVDTPEDEWIEWAIMDEMFEEDDHHHDDQDDDGLF